MKIKNFEKLTKDDFPKIPEDLFKLLNPLSEQVELLTRAAQGKLSLGENVSAELKTFKIAHDTLVEFDLQYIKNPVGVLVVKSGLLDYTRLAWERADIGRVLVKVYFDSTPSTTTEVTFLVLGD